MWSSVVRDESPMLVGMTLVRRMSWGHVATSALSVYARGTGVFFPFETCLYWYVRPVPVLVLGVSDARCSR